MYQNIKDPHSISVNQDMSLHTMWMVLTREYKTTSAATQTLAKECIQQYKYVPGTPFKEYFKSLEALCKAASDVGCTITDDFHSRFLTSLPPDHLWILQSHGAHSYGEIKCTLIKYNMMVESAGRMTSSSAAPNALATTGRNSSGIVCNNCKCLGHVKRNCWAHGGESEGKAPHWYNALKGMELIKTAVTPTAVVSSLKPAESPTTATAAATIYDFGDFEPGGTENTLACNSPADPLLNRLGGEAVALLSEAGVRPIV
ncbi:hypothetical protein GYMLUDRAFT_246122 [Collybiopsis luxurians FD-317 M1]|uniref:Unplaced genomic scaffold GYMLUscaffold_37, whole genome shotgun sequence n=1 Tax=Collybiopsis luxurians FD-317 M1 TaxID=944289 RepID=A0A0D0CJ95_9AGAR|nr:hypothetical protein GYMLUDRAFT_246122 [Collybiopsis luxurians FD-317 M1]